MPAEGLDLFGDALNDVGRGGFACDVRQEGETDAANAGLMQALQFAGGHIFSDAGDAGCPALHVFERVDHDAVIGAVTGGLNDHVAPEAQPVDEISFCSCQVAAKGLYWAFGDRGNLSKGPMTCMCASIAPRGISNSRG